MRPRNLGQHLRKSPPRPWAGSCPADAEETAEAYLLNSLPAEEVARFEEHYLGCEKCAEVLTAAEDYVASIRIAAQRLRHGLAPADIR